MDADEEDEEEEVGGGGNIIQYYVVYIYRNADKRAKLVWID
jgi:hypothetical protein